MNFCQKQNKRFENICKIFGNKIISNDLFNTLNNNNEYNLIKYLFLGFLISPDEKMSITEFSMFWFEKEETLKNYNLIIQFIDLIINHLTKKKLDLNELDKDIIYLIEKSEISSMYFLVAEILSKFNKEDNLYVRIFLSFYFVGIENKYLFNSLIKELKEIKNEEIMKKYDSVFEKFNFENLDENFLKLLKEYIDLILNKKNENNKKNIKDLENELIFYKKNIESIQKTDNLIENKDNNEKIIENLKITTQSIEIDDKEVNLRNIENELNFFNNFTYEESDNKEKIENFRLYYGIKRRLDLIVTLIEQIKYKIEYFEKNFQYESELFKYKTKLNEQMIFNSRLKLFIILLKNPTFFNFKRKLIDVIIFYILLNNKNSLSLEETYIPSKENLVKILNLLRKKLQEKENENKSNNIKNNSLIEKIQKDINKIINFQSKEKIFKPKTIENKKEYSIKFLNSKIKDFNFKLSNILSFLTFYKKKLNSSVHLGKEYLEYYTLPKSLFNSNLSYVKYLFDIYEKEEENNENYNDENLKEINIKENVIYQTSKKFPFELIWKILFDLDNIIQILYSQTNEEMKRKKEETFDMLNFLNSIHINFPEQPKIFNNIVEDTFTSNIKDKINEKLNLYKSNILNKIKYSLNKIINSNFGPQWKNQFLEIISIIQIIVKYESNFDYDKLYLESEKNYNKLMLYDLQYKIMKLYIIIDFFYEIKISFQSFTEKIKNEYLDYLNVCNKIVENLKDEIQKNNTSESGFNIFKEWKNEQINKGNSYIDEIKQLNVIINELIGNNKEFEIDSEFIFEEKFSLWIIKNNLEEYLKS